MEHLVKATRLSPTSCGGVCLMSVVIYVFLMRYALLLLCNKDLLQKKDHKKGRGSKTGLNL